MGKTRRRFNKARLGTPRGVERLRYSSDWRRRERSQIASETLSILDKGYYTTDTKNNVHIDEMLNYSLENTQLYASKSFVRSNRRLRKVVTTLPRAVPEGKFETNVKVLDCTTFSAARKLIHETGNACVLSFASAKNRGGGFLNGSQAQEECLARSSALYSCLSVPAVEYFYTYHNQNRDFCYSDLVVFADKVPFFREDSGSLLKRPLCISVVSCAAPNNRECKKRQYPEEKVRQSMESRIDTILTVCAMNEQKNIVLGAFGCGVFRNDPNEVSFLFRQLLNSKFTGVFENVIFAILDNGRSGRIIQAFRHMFAEDEQTEQK